MRKRTVYIVIIIILLSVVGFHFLIPQRNHRILIIQSYEATCKSAQALTQYIIKDLKKSDANPDIRFFYLDCESFLEKQEIHRMYHLLDSISSDGWKPEVILVNDDPATYSLLKTNHPFTHTTPIVFAGVNFPNWKLIKQFPNVTGFHDSIDIIKNFLFIRDIPKTQPGLFTIVDSTFIDRKLRQQIAQVIKGKKVVGYMTPWISEKEQVYLWQKKGYISLSDFPARGNNRMTANLLWTISNFGKYRAYLHLKRDFTTINIANINNNFSYTAINEEFGFDHNLLAGYFTPIDIQAQDEVNYATKIILGTPPSKLPIIKSQKEYLADWQIMKKHHLSMQDFPKYCNFANISFYERHPILATILFIILGVFLLSLFCYMFVIYKKERHRKQIAYAAITREREILKLTLEGSNTFVWIVRNDIITIDLSFWKYIGKQHQSISLKQLIQYVHPSLQQSFKNFITDKRPMKSIEILLTFDKKEYQWWTIRCTTSSSYEGETIISGIIFNIQEFKDKEEELRKARIIAEKANMKQSFFANINHEIRTPLNAILGFTSILIETDNLTQEEKVEYADIVRKNSKDLLKLIDEVLTITDIDSGNIMFKTETKDVKDIIDKIYYDYIPKVPDHLQFLKEEDIEISINTDIFHLSDVITHLLDNALKFTKEGHICIGYHYRRNTNEVELFVEDTGSGIAQEELDLVFSRFYKRDIFTPGMGLGLSVCKIIIDKLNGRLTASSEIGKGSRFSIFIPCSSAE